MIMGDEGVPVQVDGEAWIQAPGYIRIMHKNRAQMLTRDRVGTQLVMDLEIFHMMGKIVLVGATQSFNRSSIFW